MSEDLWRHPARVVHNTDNALLVDIEGDEYWIPKSQIHDDSEVWKKGQEGDLVIHYWYARKLGFE